LQDKGMRVIDSDEWAHLYAGHLLARRTFGREGQKLDLHDCRLLRLDLLRCDLSEVVFDQTIFEKCSGVETDFSNVVFRNASMLASQWTNADFANSEWHQSMIRDCKIMGGYWLGARLGCGVIEDSLFANTDWQGARLYDIQCQRCRLSNNLHLPVAFAVSDQGEGG